MEAITRRLLDRLEERGYRGRVVSVDRLTDLKEGIEGWRRQGLFDEEIYQEYLRSLHFEPPEALPGVRSLIIVANPQPQIRIGFGWHGKTVRLVLPPTYVYRRPDAAVRDVLASVLDPAGYRLEKALVPVKLLAVRSGLGRYGKNNVCYVPGFGSFHRLVAFYSDLPPAEVAWREPEMLEACQRCTACLHRCPTGAITAERFLVRAERCLTFHNERAAAVPAWVDPSWHNALLGCMHCQRVCPENKPHLGWVEPGADFTEEETSLLLDGVPAERLPAEMTSKLEPLDLMEALDVLPRNLRFLLAASKGADG